MPYTMAKFFFFEYIVGLFYTHVFMKSSSANYYDKIFSVLGKPELFRMFATHGALCYLDTFLHATCITS